MKMMILGVVCLAVLAVGCSRASVEGESTGASKVDSNWLTDFEEAKRLAAEQGRPILADFSGSDWCGWCIKLDKEVFSQASFAAYAKENLVLFLADFPRRTSIPDEVKAQNERLAETYGIQGFPTVLLLDATGKAVARTGYQRGGPDAYVEHIKELVNKAGR